MAAGWSSGYIIHYSIAMGVLSLIPGWGTKHSGKLQLDVIQMKY